jgi:hypothetical protein
MPRQPETLPSVNGHIGGDRSEGMFLFRRYGILGTIYIIIGLVIAWQHHYITLRLVENVASAIIAVFLWWLVLLGANLHIH